MKNEDKPYVDNYPPLAEWLKKIDAVCNWQIMQGSNAVECWRTPNGRVFIIQVYAAKQGWEIYTSSDSIKIDETINDANERLGLPKTFCFGGYEPKTEGVIR